MEKKTVKDTLCISDNLESLFVKSVDEALHMRSMMFPGKTIYGKTSHFHLL
jgi:hypothetical protein